MVAKPPSLLSPRPDVEHLLVAGNLDAAVSSPSPFVVDVAAFFSAAEADGDFFLLPPGTKDRASFC